MHYNIISIKNGDRNGSKKHAHKCVPRSFILSVSDFNVTGIKIYQYSFTAMFSLLSYIYHFEILLELIPSHKPLLLNHILFPYALYRNPHGGF